MTILASGSDGSISFTAARSAAVARAGSPDEAAEAYLYLIRGTYTTGQVIRVDGGMSFA